MKFHEYLKIMQKYLGDKKTNPEFFDYFISLIQEDCKSGEEQFSDEDNRYNPFLNFDTSSKNKILSGLKPVAQKNAMALLSHLNDTELTSEIDKLNDSQKDPMIKAFRCKGYDFPKSTLGADCSRLLAELLSDLADGNNQNKNSNEEIPTKQNPITQIIENATIVNQFGDKNTHIDYVENLTI